MATPFIGEIRTFGFNFAPEGWALCNGQLLQISQNQALFAVIGTTYGGDGQSTFGLPNLQGAAPMNWGAGNAGFTTTLGETLGQPAVSLTIAQIPAHTHGLQTAQPSTAAQSTGTPSAAAWLGNSSAGKAYSDSTSPVNTTFAAAAIGATGGAQPHANVQPVLAVSFCIALDGIFPPRS
jgi:microcystin-dependent protein